MEGFGSQHQVARGRIAHSSVQLDGFSLMGLSNCHKEWIWDAVISNNESLEELDVAFHTIESKALFHTLSRLDHLKRLRLVVTFKVRMFCSNGPEGNKTSNDLYYVPKLILPSAYSSTTQFHSKGLQPSLHNGS